MTGMLRSCWLFKRVWNHQLIVENSAKLTSMATKQVRPIPRPNGPEEYPFYFDYPGAPPKRVCLEMFQKRHMMEVRKIWKEASSEGNGLAYEEDFSHVEENIVIKADPRYIGAVLVDVDKCEVMAAVFVFPSYLCRSEHPLLSGALLLVSKAYRGSGVAEYMASINPVHSAHQYDGVLSRITVTAKSMKAALKVNVIFLGVILWCTRLTDRGWFHDNIAFHSWKPSNEEKAKHFRMPELVKTRKYDVDHRMLRRQPFIADPPTLYHHSLGRIKVTLADSAGIWQIQGILRGMAIAGDGFGLDEFTDDGVYNEKLIVNCCYWVVRKERDGEMVAVILSGESGLCRSLNKEQAAGVVIVLKPFRRQGLGNQLVEWCETQGQACGYKAILTDVLACNAAGLGLLRKRQFLITGTLIRSCIVGGHYTDSYVHWKLFKHGAYPTSNL